MDILNTLAHEISSATGKQIQLTSQSRVGGGSINQTLRVSGNQQDYFVKLNQPQLLDMFAAETDGLHDLRKANAIGVPEVICFGANSSYSWLVLEFIKLGHGGREGFSRAGQALAQLHQTSSPRFGWHRHNTIGSTPQLNTWTDNWLEFWQKHRLGYQMELAIDNGYRGAVIENTQKLIEVCDRFLTHSPQASLLHGDLWSGNLAFNNTGEPLIYDPAVYYGDREADLAMTELFGGFSPDFYSAYNEVWPIDAGYTVRKTLYNLYHILNHMNLFGGGYQSQAVSMTGRLLSEAA